MEKSVLLIFVLLAIVAISQAVPLAETPKRKLNEDSNKESRFLEQLTRTRRKDYYDWMDYVPAPKSCSNCTILNIGNGYKNENHVTFNGPVPNNWGFSN